MADLPKIWVDTEDLEEMARLKLGSIKTRIFDHEERDTMPYVPLTQAQTVPPKFNGPCGLDLDSLVALLGPLVRIVNAYDTNGLDEARPEWFGKGIGPSEVDPREIELYSGRGGRRLLTLGDCIYARDFLKGVAWSCGVEWDNRSGMPRGFK